MLRRSLIAALPGLLLPARLYAQSRGSRLERLDGFPAPLLDFNFKDGVYRQDAVGYGTVAANFITTSRASTGTDLLPTSPSGYAYSTFGNNVARITPGLGLLVEESRTNRLLNSTAPATQTTASIGTGTYTLWVNGSGSATSSAGTATGSGFGAATQGSPNNFTLTGAGTVTITVSGSLNAFQLELGAFGTSLVVTAGAAVVRAADAETATTSPVFGGALSAVGVAIPAAPISGVTNQTLFSINDGTLNNRITMLRPGVNAIPSDTYVASGVTTIFGDASLVVWAPNTRGKFAMAVTQGDYAQVFNGGQIVAGTPNFLVGPNKLDIGKVVNSGQQWNGYIERVQIWPTMRLNNAALQSVTK